MRNIGGDSAAAAKQLNFESRLTTESDELFVLALCIKRKNEGETRCDDREWQALPNSGAEVQSSSVQLAS